MGMLQLVHTTASPKEPRWGVRRTRAALVALVNSFLIFGVIQVCVFLFFCIFFFNKKDHLHQSARTAIIKYHT